MDLRLQLTSLYFDHILQEEIDESVAFITRGLEQKRLLPAIAHKYTMEETSIAHKHVIENNGAKGKLVLLL